MSGKERETLVVMERVKRKELSLAEAAEVLTISYRQCSRRKGRYEKEGAAGLVHRLRGVRGGRSNRSIAEDVRERIVEHYRNGGYKGFGPLLFTEKLLSEHEIRVDHETVRRLLIKEGLWQVERRRKETHAAWRERRSHFGELVQMDGSHHRWFEDRGEKCCLMVMIDDATGIRMSLLSKEETTDAAMRLLWMWIVRYGIPKALYTDKKNVYVPAEKDLEKGRLEGREVLTQFGRACKKLSVEIVRAHSPQAKGRVERSNGVYQDRLVKEMRLKQISDIAAGNELLQGGFDDGLNRRFARPPAKKADYHRSASGHDLEQVFCIEETRTLSPNWTLSFENRVYRIKPGPATNYSPASRKVHVRRYLDGSLHMFYRGNEAPFEEIDPHKKKTPRRNGTPAASCRSSIPSPDHPWRTPWSKNRLMQLSNQP